MHLTINMGKTFKILFLFLITLHFNACLEIPSFLKEEKLSLSEDFNTVEAEDYSIAIPKYMKPTKQLNSEAALQYQNVFKNSYIIILDEPKEAMKNTFIAIEEWNEADPYAENYKNFQLQSLAEGMDITNEGPSKNATLNGLDARILALDGKVDGVAHEIAYTLAFIEGEDSMYMAMLWCLKDDRNKFAKVYDQMLNSFKATE